MPRTSNSTGNVEAYTRLKAECGQSAIPASYIAYVCLPPDGELPLVIVHERKHPIALSVEVYREPERRNMSVLRYCDEIVRGVARTRNRAKQT